MRDILKLRKDNFVKSTVLGLIKSYKKMISPFLPMACRHIPTCSDYAYTAIEQYGLAVGTGITFKRLLRCRPFGTRGYDPVP